MLSESATTTATFKQSRGATKNLFKNANRITAAARAGGSFGWDAGCAFCLERVSKRRLEGERLTGEEFWLCWCNWCGLVRQNNPICRNAQSLEFRGDTKVRAVFL